MITQKDNALDKKKSNLVPYTFLTPTTLVEGLNHLCVFDADFAQIHTRLGAPPMWAREQGFPTLVHIILEQQVSLASARAAFTKLEQSCHGVVTPQLFLQFDDAALKRMGFSHQKAGYCRGLARSILAGELNLDALSTLGDVDARDVLLKVKGIGPWTADIYLLMSLLRPDVWPAGDLALVVAYQKLKKLPTRPSTPELAAIAENWRPWRAVAARLLWHFYLNQSKD